MSALKCEDLNLWTWARYYSNDLQVILCPDCGAVVYHAPENLKLHIEWHRGLNIWDPNYQNFIKESEHD